MLGIAGIIFIWVLAAACTLAMKKIAPENKGYPKYALFVCAASSVLILIGIL